MAAEATRPAGAQTAVEAAPESSQGLLLVVDHDQASREMLVRTLSVQGFAVDTAKNGRQALTILGEEDFDLVLLDAAMPEMDGFEVLRRMKADSAIQHIPVFMMTGSTDRETAARCERMGAADCLSKPLETTTLGATLSEALKQRSATDRDLRLL
jgi:CheY-like chemotaxis protein